MLNAVGAYIHRVLVAWDQNLNVFFGGLPDETISARAQKAKERGKLWGRILVGFLDWLQPHHGELAVSHDEQRADTAEKDLEK